MAHPLSNNEVIGYDVVRIESNYFMGLIGSGFLIINQSDSVNHLRQVVSFFHSLFGDGSLITPRNSVY